MMNTSQIQGCLLLTKSVHEKGRRMSFKGLETGLRRLSLTWFVLLALTQSSVGQEAVGAQRLRIIRIQFGSLLVSFVPGDMIIDDRAIHFDPGSPKNSFELQLSDVAEIKVRHSKMDYVIIKSKAGKTYNVCVMYEKQRCEASVDPFMQTLLVAIHAAPAADPASTPAPAPEPVAPKRFSPIPVPGSPSGAVANAPASIEKPGDAGH